MQTEETRRARILVLYHSNTGNTKLMADLVAEGAASVPAFFGGLLVLVDRRRRRMF
jgi:multimeric flavodoxin WrbA